MRIQVRSWKLNENGTTPESVFIGLCFYRSTFKVLLFFSDKSLNRKLPWTSATSKTLLNEICQARDDIKCKHTRLVRLVYAKQPENQVIKTRIIKRQNIIGVLVFLSFNLSRLFSFLKMHFQNLKEGWRLTLSDL